MLHDFDEVAAARSDARHSRNVIGLERMLHADHKPQPQDTNHDFRTRYEAKTLSLTC